MATYLDPRTLSVGDTLISRDAAGEVRVVVEKVEFTLRAEQNYSSYRNARPNRWVEARISGGGKVIVLTGSGSGRDNFRPDGTCAIYPVGRAGWSLEVIKK